MVTPFGHFASAPPFTGPMHALALFRGAPTVSLDFRTVYEAEVGFVFRALVRLGVPRADAPDATQQVFLVVHRRLASFDGSSAVRTWLFGICLRVASDHRDRAHVRREVTGAPLPQETIAPPQLDAVARTQARSMLETLLATLDDEKRAVFVLYELEDWSMAEVAKSVGCPLRTAYSRYRAARERLELEAKRLWPEETP